MCARLQLSQAPPSLPAIKEALEVVLVSVQQEGLQLDYITCAATRTANA